MFSTYDPGDEFGCLLLGSLHAVGLFYSVVPISDPSEANRFTSDGSWRTYVNV